MTFLQRVCNQFFRTADSQEQKGMEKYGHEVQPHDPKWDWNRMAEEEIVDAYKYILAERERRDAIILEVTMQLEKMGLMLCDPTKAAEFVAHAPEHAVTLNQQIIKLKGMSAIFK